MSYFLKCNFCDREIEYEPTFEDGISLCLVSYVCDDCKERIQKGNEGIEGFEDPCIGEPFDSFENRYNEIRREYRSLLHDSFQAFKNDIKSLFKR